MSAVVIKPSNSQDNEMLDACVARACSLGVSVSRVSIKSIVHPNEVSDGFTSLILEGYRDKKRTVIQCALKLDSVVSDSLLQQYKFRYIEFDDTTL